MLGRFLGKLSPAQRLRKGQHQDTPQQEVAQSGDGHIAKADQQPDQEERRNPTAAQLGQLNRDDLAQVGVQFQPEGHQIEAAEVRFQRALEAVLGVEHGGFHDRVGGRAEGFPADVVVTGDPRRHNGDERRKGDQRQHHPLPAAEQNQEHQDGNDQPPKRVARQPPQADHGAAQPGQNDDHPRPPLWRARLLFQQHHTPGQPEENHHQQHRGQP